MGEFKLLAEKITAAIVSMEAEYSDTDGYSF